MLIAKCLISDFSLTTWMQSQGVTLVSNVTDLTLDTLYEDLNIAQYLWNKCPDRNTSFTDSKCIQLDCHPCYHYTNNFGIDCLIAET